MALSRKLTATDEQISCDQLYLSKVCLTVFILLSKLPCKILLTNKSDCTQAGRERQRYDFDDFDVPQKFNI